MGPRLKKQLPPIKMIFNDRKSAGLMLALELKKRAIPNPIVIALPRGGLPIGFEVAKMLKAPLDIALVRKLGAPENRELAIGAIGEEGVFWINQEIISTLHITDSQIKKIVAIETKEIEHRKKIFSECRPNIPIKDKTVILVDDGLATGATAITAARLLYKQGVEKVIIAVPVCAFDSVELVEKEVDQLVCLEKPKTFFSVSSWYENFSQITDEEVIAILNQAKSKSKE